jgi:hypothetical protein
MALQRLSSDLYGLAICPLPFQLLWQEFLVKIAHSL